MKTLLKCLLLILLLVNSLDLNAQKKGVKKVESAVFDPVNNILVRYDEPTNKFKFAVKEEILRKSILMADPRIESIDSIFVTTFNTNRYYLSIHCTDTEKNSRKKALLLKELSKGIFRADYEDSDFPICLICEGVCCVNCNFRMSTNGPLGCECPEQCANADEEIPGYCNQVLGFKVAMILSTLK
jgi:hypothetical protein